MSTSGGLKNLCLAEQRVADLGAIALFNALPFSNLRTLNLKDNNLTDDCCEALNEMLGKRGVCHLEVLVLSKNGISDEGLMRCLPGLEVNTTLHALDLSHNSINHRGMRAMRNSLLINRGLQGISLIGNLSEDDHGCEAFLKSRVLQKVAADISQNKDFFDQYKAYDIKHMSRNPPGTCTLIDFLMVVDSPTGFNCNTDISSPAQMWPSSFWMI